MYRDGTFDLPGEAEGSGWTKVVKKLINQLIKRLSVHIHSINTLAQNKLKCMVDEIFRVGQSQ